MFVQIAVISFFMDKVQLQQHKLLFHVTTLLSFIHFMGHLMRAFATQKVFMEPCVLSKPFPTPIKRKGKLLARGPLVIDL